MIIQDLIFMVNSALFSVALLPPVLSKNKPPWGTSLLTATVFTSFTWVYASEGWYYATATTGLTTALWFVLFFQKVLRRA